MPKSSRITDKIAITSRHMLKNNTFSKIDYLLFIISQILRPLSLQTWNSQPPKILQLGTKLATSTLAANKVISHIIISAGANNISIPVTINATNQDTSQTSIILCFHLKTKLYLITKSFLSSCNSQSFKCSLGSPSTTKWIKLQSAYLAQYSHPPRKILQQMWRRQARTKRWIIQARENKCLCLNAL